jgi:hypothetical protein
MMGEDVSSCGYTATNGQWFGMCFPINTGSTPLITSPILGANEMTETEEPQISFREFYTDNETGVTEMSYIRNWVTTGKSRQYYTIFYLSGDTGSTPITEGGLDGLESELGERTDTRMPFYALARGHAYYSGNSHEEIYDLAYDGVYDLYSGISLTNTSTQKGNELSGYIGTITVVRGNGLKKDSVTKAEPGFAHVLTPDSVYYNDLSKSSGGESSDFVIPGASTDAPGSKIPLSDSGSGGEHER